MKKIINLFYIVLFIICISCNSEQKKEYYENDISINRDKNYIGKKIIFPSKSKLFANDTIRIVDSTFFNNDMIKIVHIVNVNCSNCINELYSWKEIISLIEDDCEIIFLLTNIDNSEVNISRIIDTANDVFYVSDINQSFKHQNNLIYPDINLHTFLLDRSNEIKLMGDPIFDNMLVSEYMNIIALLNNDSTKNNLN